MIVLVAAVASTIVTALVYKTGLMVGLRRLIDRPHVAVVHG
jgi:hypothetical protein